MTGLDRMNSADVEVKTGRSRELLAEVPHTYLTGRKSPCELSVYSEILS